MPVLPDFSQARFERGAPITNPYFPLVPGTVSFFSGTSTDGETTESNDFFVTSLKKNILGVQTFAIRDTAYDDDVLIEDTIDFFAQDTKGNVWYFGEKVINYEYDDDGNFLGTNDDGAWIAGKNDALPGHIMPANPVKGLSYFNEFAPGVALDEALVLSTAEPIEIDLGQFTTLKTLDTSQLDPGIREFKYYAPGIGLVRTDEELDANDNPGLVIELRGTVQAGTSHPPEGAEVLEKEDFVGDGTRQWVTVVAEDSELDNALGYYTFNLHSGVIGEGRILFDGTDDLEPGDAVSIRVPPGKGIGFFFVPNGAELGVDLSEFEDGGLFFTNMLTGRAARITDGMAPIVTNADDEPLPVSVFHAMGAREGSNLLNPGLGLQAVEWEVSDERESAEKESGKKDDDEFVLIGFEDQRRTQADYDGDFDDFLFAFSDSRIDLEDLGRPPQERPTEGERPPAEIAAAIELPMLGVFERALWSPEQLV